MKSICLAVLNYNGIRHLEILLPGLKDACRYSPIRASVVVLDNCSTQGDLEWIQRQHSDVRCVVARRNDFFFSYNWLLEQLQDEFVVLLNNDLRVRPDFLAPIVEHLQGPDVFSVSARSYDWEGVEITSGPSELLRCGGFYSWPFNLHRQETCNTLFTSGAFMAVDRRKFMELGGFNRLFYPAYCEDLDLCFRAWRRGWRSVYEPASVVWHRERASWQSRSDTTPISLNLRNSLLFQWSTLPMSQGRFARYWSLAKILGGELARGRRLWWRVYPDAYSRWFRTRRKGVAMRVSPEELEDIELAIRAPLRVPHTV